MTARVLVVDDVRPNLKLLETRLSIEYFEVLTATNGPDAIAICETGGCDLVLLDVMMPGMDGFEVCRRLRAASETAYLPIILVTALDRPADRVRGLEAGADDFLTKPVDEIALIARVRSLARLKFSIDELRSRAAHSAATGMEESVEALKPGASERGRILLVDHQRSSFERLVNALTPHHDVIQIAGPGEALAKASSENVDLMIVSLGLGEFDGLRLCSQARSHASTRNLRSSLSLIAKIDRRFFAALNSESMTTCPRRYGRRPHGCLIKSIVYRKLA
jgi:two-component system, cell cycle response regulator